MYVKNLLKSGTYLIPVPMGIPLTLQYSVIGKLQKVGIGHDLEHLTDISQKILSLFISTPIVPTDIPIKNGTTWVRGVLQTDTIYSINGDLPNCLYDLMIQDYIDNPQNFKFYAINIEGTSTSFKNPTSNLQWLHAAKFLALRGWSVPADVDAAKFHHMLTTGKYGFNQSYMSEYVIFSGSGYEYHMLNLKQYVISSIKTHLNPSGWIIADIFTKDESNHEVNVISTNYSNVVRNRLDKKAIVVCGYDNIAGLLNEKNTPNRLMVCPICGKQYGVNITGITQCDDPHCMSTKYNDVVHMLSVFNQPIISWEVYLKLITEHKLLSIANIFELPEYAEAKISVKLSTILSAIVPLTVVPDAKLFDLFCGKCNNELKTIRYYMENPRRIMTDLDIKHPVTIRFIEWLEDPANLLLFDTFVDLPQISISLKSKRFEGLPLLRDKVFYLNGDFKHGSYRDMVALLESFSATISPEYNNKTVNCVLIGDLHQNIRGSVLRDAAYNHIPIIEEHKLFESYQLDSDIKENLGEV